MYRASILWQPEVEYCKAPQVLSLVSVRCNQTDAAFLATPAWLVVTNLEQAGFVEQPFCFGDDVFGKREIMLS
jgi:hypothetical protein